MKKTTTSLLTKRIAQYGTLTTAMAGLTDGNSQTIVHVDLATTTGYFYGGMDSMTPTYQLNLDGNSLNDFSIVGIGSSMAPPAVLVKADPGFNSVLVDNNGYPMVLYDSNAINTSQNWINASNNATLNLASCFVGNWCGIQNKYLGVRFQIGTGNHFGWVKLDVNASGSSFTIKE